MSLPAFYNRYLDAVAERVVSKPFEATDSFFFITDLHVPANSKRSGEIIAKLSGMTPVSKTLCGGDFPCAFSEEFSSDRAALDYSVECYRKYWVEPIESANVALYTARGNHDFSIRRSMTSDEGATIPADETRKIILGSKAVANQACVFNGDPDAICYYFDNTAAKIRYIVADTTDSANTSRKYWTLCDSMRAPQLEWLAAQAFATVPSGWLIVVMQHSAVTGCVTTLASAAPFASFLKLMEAYQNRQSWTSPSGRFFDFSAAQGRIFMNISGHHHCERQTFQNGILHVTEPCDALYKDYIYRSPLCGKLPVKEENTIFEHTFDIVRLEPLNGVVDLTRFGGGQDRVIHTEAASVSVGDIHRFKATRLEDPLSWTIYDGDDIVERPNPENRWAALSDYKTTNAAIDADGVAKGLLPGSAMAVAMDASLRKEIFPLVIAGR